MNVPEFHSGQSSGKDLSARDRKSDAASNNMTTRHGGRYDDARFIIFFRNDQTEGHDAGVSRASGGR
jgi:hypothetical protein